MARICGVCTALLAFSVSIFRGMAVDNPTDIILICFGLGCVMGTLPLVFITVPIFAPVVETLGYDLIWFGVIVVVISEIGMITPPVGINVYIMKGIARDVPLSTVFRGIFPFLLADFARLVTLIAFPALTLFLPELLR